MHSIANGQRVRYKVRDENLEITEEGVGTVLERSTLVYVERWAGSSLHKTVPGCSIKSDRGMVIYIPDAFAKDDVIPMRVIYAVGK